MNISDIPKIAPFPFDYSTSLNAETKQENNIFDQVLSSAMNVVNETNRYQLLADQAQLDFATGRNDNMLSVMMAEQKAYTSLNFTVQVTNKVIEAYREIMRIQL